MGADDRERNSSGERISVLMLLQSHERYDTVAEFIRRVVTSLFFVDRPGSRRLGLTAGTRF